MLQEESFFSLNKELFIFFLLIIINVVGVILKHCITNEPFIESSDLEMLNIGSFLMFVLIIPLFEEFLFRGYLCFNQSKIYLLLIGIVFCISILIFLNNIYVRSILILLVIITTSILSLNTNIANTLESLINNNLFKIIFIASCLFGLIHFGNYDKFRLVNFCVIIPKILAGIFFSYLTIKYNIWISWFFHCINNLIPFSLIYTYSLFFNK